MASILTTFFESVGTTNVLVAVTCALLFGILRRASGQSSPKLPPGPLILPFPLNLVLGVFATTNRMEQLQSAKQKYGDLCCLEFNGTPKVIISSPELARELLVKRGDVTSDRRGNPVLIHALQRRGGIASKSYGKHWLALRRFSLSALRNFGMGKRSLESRINEEARALNDALSDMNKRDCGIDPADYLNNAVSNIICSITFGQRFEYSDPIFVEVVGRIRKMFGENPPTILRMLVYNCPIVMRSPWPKMLRKIIENVVGLKEFIKAQVNYHEDTLDEENIRDIVDMYLVEIRRLQTEKDPSEACLEKEGVWECVFDLFIAGTETTATTLIWFLLLMADKPDIQSKVAEEIDSVIGQERAPSYEDRKRMPFTEATLSEVLRFRPMAPFAVPHFAREDIHVRDYTIPKGHEMWLNIMGIHHDPELFPEPGKFNPNRFLSQDERTYIKSDAFLPFSVGPRSCLGEQLAKMEVFLFATNILQRFVIRLPPGATADYSVSHRIRTLLPNDFNICINKRSK